MVQEACQTYVRNTTGLHFVEKVWIRQTGSNDAIRIKSFSLQENVDSPYFIQYGLNSGIAKFVIDK